MDMLWILGPGIQSDVTLFRDTFTPSPMHTIAHNVPRELRAPKDFLKRRYNLLDMSAMRVAY